MNKREILQRAISEGFKKTSTDGVLTYAKECSPLTFDVLGDSTQDTTKKTYSCSGSESGDYYFTYNSVNYQFTMPTITSSSVLVFDTSTLKLYLGSTEITTTTASTGTLITLSESPNPSYPVEIVSVRGKNLFNPTLTSQTINGVAITKNEDNSYTLNGTSTAKFDIVWSTSVTLEPGTYYIGLVTTYSGINLYFNKSGGGFEILTANLTEPYYTLTLNETTTYPGFKSYVGAAGKVFDNVTFYPMICTTLPFTYLPYNTIEIEQRGKNLFDENSDITTGKIYDGSGNQISGSNTDFALNDYIEVKPSTTYTISGSIYIRLCEYNSSKTFISRSVTTGGATSSTFTTTANTYYVRLSALTTSIDGIQIEIGASTTDYEPYVTPRTYQIPLGSNTLKGIGSVKDKLTIDYLGNVSLVKNIGEMQLVGTESFWNLTTGTDRYSFWFRSYLTDAKPIKNLKYCNYFVYDDDVYTTASVPSICENSSTVSEANFMFIFTTNGDQGTDLAGWKSWLATNKPKVQYLLNTPTTETLTPTEPIILYNGTNIFSISSIGEPISNILYNSSVK